MPETEEQNSALGWRKSSYSVANGQCVETAAIPGTVMIRDSTSQSDISLRVADGAWQEFINRVKGA